MSPSLNTQTQSTQTHSTGRASKRALLARTIADALDDSKQVNRLTPLCNELPLSVILRAYTEAKTFPLDKIRKARTALFFYLIKRFSDERK